MKKNSTLTGKQVHFLNCLQVVGWAVLFIALMIIQAWAMANDPTWVSMVLVGVIWLALGTATIAWWVKESY